MKGQQKTKEELVNELMDIRQQNAELEASLVTLKQREEGGEEAEETTKAMIEAFDGFIYVCSPNYEVEFMNERFIQRTGHNPTGEKCYQALHDLKEVCPWCVNEKVQNGETVRWEVQSPKDDRWYYVVNTPVRHRDGTVSKMAMIQDITERKQAEELLRKAKDELEVRVQERTSELESSVQRLEKEISVRKETEAALRDSQERLAMALEAAELNVWDWDLINGKAAWSYRGFEMLGYSPDDFEAHVGTWKRLIHAEDWPSVSKSLNEHLEGKLPTYEAEYRIRTKSGDWRWISARGKVLERDPNGRAIRMLGTSQDITDRKHAEEEIREQREFLHTVVESLSHPFYVINADDYTIELANRATMLTSTEEKQACYSVLHHRECPCDGAEHPCPIEQVKKRGQPALLEHIHHDQEGIPRYVEVHAHPIFDAQGRVVKIIEYCLDITNRKLAEDSLRQSEANFRAVFDSMNDAIFVHDMATGEILDVNRKMLEMYGYSLEDARRLTIEDISSGEPPYSQEDALKWTSLASEGQPQLFEWQAKHKDGRSFWVEVNLKRAVIGGKDRLLAVVRDVTERRLAREEREKLRSQLFQAQKMEVIGTLTGGIAHDFNNMLTIILGYSEMLLLDRDENDPAYDDLQKILQTGRNGAELVQRLLVFSRKAETNPVPLDLNRQVRNTEGLLSRTLPKAIRIEIGLADDLKPVHADPSQMDQIVMNLAINAKEAMPDGGILTLETSNVRLESEFCSRHSGVAPGDYVLLSISDTGRGMDKEIQDRMFDPFFTVKGWDSRKGTGLGLPVVLGIVQQHGGCIECLSEVGKGTTFNIYLPKFTAEPLSGQADSRDVPALGTETILLVDDEDLVRELGERILTKSGYRVLSARNGREALDIYKQYQPDIALVILDLIMPEMSGSDCLRELVKIDPQVRVIVSSGHSDSDDLHQVAHQAVRGSVKKPYGVGQFLKTVRKVLDET